MKIYLDLEKCIGCGSCEATCPDIFKLGSDNKVHLKEAKKKENQEEKEMEESSCSGEAADICPVDAIRIEQ